MLIRPPICSWLAVEEEDVIAEGQPDVVREGPAWNEERDVNRMSWRVPAGRGRRHIDRDWRARASASTRDRAALSGQGVGEELTQCTPGSRTRIRHGDCVDTAW